MVVGQGVPEGLAAMPPGPRLAAALSGLVVDLVPNDEIVEVMEAQSRQLAHEQARMFSVMNEVLHRLPAAVPGVVRRGSRPGQFAADEVRAALVWSRRHADRETDLAFALVVVLPQVQETLLAGRIDRGKAAVFAEHLVDLSVEQAEAICGRVLPAAPGLTPWQIADRIKRLILELDPEYYARRYAAAVRDRKVVAYLDADGTAVITGSGLPVEDAAAAVERVDRLARAVRRAGHPNTLDQLRADVFLGLLDGSLHGLSRDAIVAALLERGRASAAEGTAERPDGPSESAAPDSAAPDSAAARLGPRPAGVEIRVPLSTLLGRDERHGELPGWGPVTAGVARAVVARQRRAEWRWVVVDQEGRWMSDGITRRRPADTPHTGVAGGVVEIQIPQNLLTELHTEPPRAGAWASVIADVAAQHHDRDRRARDLDAHPDRRFPRAGLRRHVQIRDRFCVFRGCRAPARSADQDHTIGHSRGGPTVAHDLGPACRHDHTLKTEGGWDLRQPEPGVFVWISPLGRRYPVRPEPVLPPPVEPVTREPEPWHDEPAGPTERSLHLRPEPRAPPPPPAPRHARRIRLEWCEPRDPGDPPPF